MQEYTPFFIMKFMWAVSIVLCSLCKNSKIKGFGSKNFKNERWKNTKQNLIKFWDMNLWKPPSYLAMSQIGYW